MAYDEGLAQRIREALESQPGLEEKKMFGGISFMLHGNMCCGVIKDEMVARVGPDQGDLALGKPHTREFDFTGKPMAGWVLVGQDGLGSDEALQDWVRMSMDFALSLPPK